MKTVPTLTLSVIQMAIVSPALTIPIVPHPPHPSAQTAPVSAAQATINALARNAAQMEPVLLVLKILTVLIPPTQSVIQLHTNAKLVLAMMTAQAKSALQMAHVSPVLVMLSARTPSSLFVTHKLMFVRGVQLTPSVLRICVILRLASALSVL